MWENIVEQGSPKVTIWPMRIACCIPKATNTHSVCVILIAFPLQQWLYEHISALIRTLSFFFFFFWRCDQMQAMATSFMRFLRHTQRRTTFGRTPLDKWSVRRRCLYPSTHNRDRHPSPRRDSNPQSQHWSIHKFTQTARPLGPAANKPLSNFFQ